MLNLGESGSVWANLFHLDEFCSVWEIDISGKVSCNLGKIGCI